MGERSTSDLTHEEALSKVEALREQLKVTELVCGHVALRRDLAGAVELLEEARGYLEHQSWRCGHPDRYPLDEVDPPDCPCGLHQFDIRLKAALRDLIEKGTPDA